MNSDNGGYKEQALIEYISSLSPEEREMYFAAIHNSGEQNRTAGATGASSARTEQMRSIYTPHGENLYPNIRHLDEPMDYEDVPPTVPVVTYIPVHVEGSPKDDSPTQLDRTHESKHDASRGQQFYAHGDSGSDSRSSSAYRQKLSPEPPRQSSTPTVYQHKYEKSAVYQKPSDIGRTPPSLANVNYPDQPIHRQTANLTLSPSPSQRSQKSPSTVSPPTAAEIAGDDKPATSGKKCFLCGLPRATLTCPECFGNNFCDDCSITIHLHARRKNHVPVPLIRTPSPQLQDEPDFQYNQSASLPLMTNYDNYYTKQLSGSPGNIGSFHVTSENSSSLGAEKRRSLHEEREQSASFPQTDSDGSTWTCRHCTFINEIGVSVCFVCLKTDDDLYQKKREEEEERQKRQEEERQKRQEEEKRRMAADAAVARRLEEEEKERQRQSWLRNNQSDNVKRVLNNYSCDAPNSRMSQTLPRDIPAIHASTKWERKEYDTMRTTKYKEPKSTNKEHSSSPKDDDADQKLHALARSILANEELDNFESALVAAKLMSKGHDRDVSILTASNINRLEDAELFIKSQLKAEEQLHNPEYEEEPWQSADNHQKQPHEGAWKNVSNSRDGSRKSERLANKNFASEEFPELPDTGHYDQSTTSQHSKKGSENQQSGNRSKGQNKGGSFGFGSLGKNKSKKDEKRWLDDDRQEDLDQAAGDNSNVNNKSKSSKEKGFIEKIWERL